MPCCDRSSRALQSKVVAMLLAIIIMPGAPGLVSAGQLSGKPEQAICRLDGQQSCACSFSTIETPLTFGQAAELILLYFREFPDDRYSTLLERLLQQCGGASLDAVPRLPKAGALLGRPGQPTLIQGPLSRPGERP